MRHWPLVEADLHEFYGIDIQSPILDQRSWAWLRIRVDGLLARPPVMLGEGADGEPVWMQTTRIGLQLRPPGAQ